MTNILIVDDHKMVRDGLKAMIHHFEGMDVIGEAENGSLCVSFLLDNPEVDVVLLDINMPVLGGPETLQEISKCNIEVAVLALSMNVDSDSISRMLNNGALGYILKEAGQEELYEAITIISNGQNYFSPQVTDAIMKSMMQSEERKKVMATSLEKFSDRELEVLRLIAEGLTNQEIGEKLFISHRTVDSHRRNLLQKTGSKNSAGLVMYGLKNGMISLDS